MCPVGWKVLLNARRTLLTSYDNKNRKQTIAIRSIINFCNNYVFGLTTRWLCFQSLEQILSVQAVWLFYSVRKSRQRKYSPLNTKLAWEKRTFSPGPSGSRVTITWLSLFIRTQICFLKPDTEVSLAFLRLPSRSVWWSRPCSASSFTGWWLSALSPPLSGH